MSNPFVSCSQAGQDTFIYNRLYGNVPGTFLDVGCNHPTLINNTVALEKLGWRGLLVDKDHEMVEFCKKVRTSPVVEGDATELDWARLWDEYYPGRVIDYLSLDIDDVLGEKSKTLVVLKNLVGSGFSFRAITCEHNRYLLGDESRNAIREFLLANSYELFAGDVSDQGLEFEDWWVLTERNNNDILVR